MMTDVTMDLPKRIRGSGATLMMYDNGQVLKFVLECKRFGYRSFIYVRSAFRDADGSLKDLYANYYYEESVRRAK